MRQTIITPQFIIKFVGRLPTSLLDVIMVKSFYYCDLFFRVRYIYLDVLYEKYFLSFVREYNAGAIFTINCSTFLSRSQVICTLSTAA